MIKRESGPRREFSTGATRQNAEGKGTPVLFPSDAYIEISKHFEEGAKTHGARNWEKGLPLSGLIDSLERHIAAEKLGQTDESHARALAWNAVVYLATKVRIERGQLPPELADIPGLSELATTKTKPGYWGIINTKRYCWSCRDAEMPIDCEPCRSCDDNHHNWGPKDA